MAKSAFYEGEQSPPLAQLAEKLSRLSPNDEFFRQQLFPNDAELDLYVTEKNLRLRAILDVLLWASPPELREESKREAGRVEAYVICRPGLECSTHQTKRGFLIGIAPMLPAAVAELAFALPTVFVRSTLVERHEVFDTHALAKLDATVTAMLRSALTVEGRGKGHPSYFFGAKSVEQSTTAADHAMSIVSDLAIAFPLAHELMHTRSGPFEKASILFAPDAAVGLPDTIRMEIEADCAAFTQLYNWFHLNERLLFRESDGTSKLVGAYATRDHSAEFLLNGLSILWIMRTFEAFYLFMILVEHALGHAHGTKQRLVHTQFRLRRDRVRVYILGLKKVAPFDDKRLHWEATYERICNQSDRYLAYAIRESLYRIQDTIT